MRPRGVGPSAVVAGVGIFAAYGLALLALARAPAAPVAAVRESSVVIATALAAIVLGEPVAGAAGPAPCSSSRASAAIALAG